MWCMTYSSDCQYLKFGYVKNDKPRQCVEKQRHYSANKGPYSQGHGLPSGHVWMWKLDYKEGRAPKNWCLWTVVLVKTPESPLDSKEIKPVNLKGNQPWIFIGRTDAEAPAFWSPDANIWLSGKDPDAGKDWGQGEKGAIEDETVGWHHRFNGPEFEQTPAEARDKEAWQCCSPWGRKELDTTGRLLLPLLSRFSRVPLCVTP